ncbi:MAG: rhamnogalacturonan acetylesterase, partial [Muribaculaceae bacterium]|nr:rhamnogalacturonan acetylesterase [Muribaculaceae bacterium]
GATPILMSLTPRNAWDDADSTIITLVKDTYGLWARQVADEENVPFVDLNEITARKFERFGKDKVKYMFYLDRIHTSTFGAQVNAESAVEGIAACPELADLAAMIVEPEYSIERHVERQPGARFVIKFGNVITKPDLEADGLLQHGDCTIKGFPLRLSVYSRIWDAVYGQLQPDDIVLINFDNKLNDKYSPLEVAGMLPGWGDETKVVKNSEGIYEVVYTEGWYLKKIVGDAKEQGAIPVIIADPNDEIARHVAQTTRTMLVDRNNPKIVISE